MLFELKRTHLTVQIILSLIKQLKSLSIFLLFVQQIINQCQQYNNVSRTGPTEMRLSSSLARAHSPIQEETRKNMWQRAVGVEEVTRLTSLLRYLYLVGRKLSSRKLRSIDLEPKGGKNGERGTYCQHKGQFQEQFAFGYSWIHAPIMLPGIFFPLSTPIMSVSAFSDMADPSVVTNTDTYKLQAYILPFNQLYKSEQTYSLIIL